MGELLQHVVASGFPCPDRLVHLFVGGSELHGAKVHGTDDLDIYGVYIEPPELILGLKEFPHFVWSTAGDDRRNGPHDVDVTLYSLRKWAGLACKGNPTALHFLFAPSETETHAWNKVVDNKNIFLARTCVKQFLGFADDQLKRMTGAKGQGKKGTRPEIEIKYGFDVKAAMHTLRLLYECRELVSTGTITFPRPEREFLIQVRTGGFSMEQVLQVADQLFVECKELEKHDSVLSEAVDPDAISSLLTTCYRESWDLSNSVAIRK
jgi:predicted nucleotidyltransferase